MGFVIWFIMAGFCAWGAAAIAKSKNCEPALWGILGFLFGIFGIIVIACMKAQPEPPKQPEA